MAPPEQIAIDQALGIVSYSLMQRLIEEGKFELPWLHNLEKVGADRTQLLKQRLELISLALETGAPLSTSEVTILLGAKPGSSRVERGGLVARRISRNVWRMSRAEKSEGNRYETFRRRL